MRSSPSTLQAQARRARSFWTEAIMEDTTLIGIDLGKHSFNVHGQGRQSTTAQEVQPQAADRILR